MDLSKLSDADLQALSAGDMSKVSTEGLQHIASQPAITMPDEKTRLENAYKEIAAKNSFSGNVLEGAATAMQRYMLGGKQMLGIDKPADRTELNAAQKAFGATAGGKVGDVVGTAAPAVLATFVPGGNTVVGQALIGGFMGAMEPADSRSQRVVNTGLGAGIGAAAKYGGDKLANWLAQRAASNAAEQAAQNSVRDAAIGVSREAGYVIPPASANPTITNRALEGFAGKLTTAQQAAIKNQPVTDNLVRKSLGLADDAPLTRETLQAIRKQAGTAYNAAKSLGTITADDAYLNAVAAVEEASAKVAKDFPVSADKKVSELALGYFKDNFDAGSAVEAIKSLRAKATSNLGTFASAEEKTLGNAQKQLANALDGLLERQAAASGQDGIVQALREARTLYAKTFSVEKALREGTGSVSAKKLGEQLARGKPLSGELKTIATMAQNFPKAVQDVTTSMPGVSPLDYTVGVGLGALTGNPLMAASAAARPIVRSAILSQPFQQMAVNAPSYGPGLLGSVVPSLLSSRTPQMALTAGLLGAATQ